MVRFTELPKSGTGDKGKYIPLADELRSRPGAWALVFEDQYKWYARAIKFGWLLGFSPSGSFEATCRGVNQKTGKSKEIYARYVGGN